MGGTLSVLGFVAYLASGFTHSVSRSSFFCKKKELDNIIQLLQDTKTNQRGGPTKIPSHSKVVMQTLALIAANQRSHNMKKLPRLHCRQKVLLGIQEFGGGSVERILQQQIIKILQRFPQDSSKIPFEDADKVMKMKMDVAKVKIQAH